jgi:hypothetical protein
MKILSIYTEALRDLTTPRRKLAFTTLWPCIPGISPASNSYSSGINGAREQQANVGRVCASFNTRKVSGILDGR